MVKTGLAVGAMTVVGGTVAVAALGEPFETDVEVKKLPDGAEYRLKGLSPRQNDNFPDEPVIMQYLLRTRERVRRYYEDYFAESNVKVLLPPMLPLIYRPNGGKNDYILVLDLDKTLVYTEFKVSRGHRTLKRPGVDFFLDWAGKNFAEVVLFSDSERMDSEHLVTKLDKNFPNGHFVHLLWRGDMRTIDGELVKDLSRMNRDLSRVIVIDDNAAAVAAHPENLLQVKAFEGESDDTVLVDLIPLLNAMISTNGDVRKLLPNWAGVPNPGHEFTRANALRWEQQARAAALPSSLKAPASSSSSPSSPAPSGGYSILGIKIW